MRDIMQKINKIKIFIFACFFISITICENKNPYSETVNELIVRKKLSSKIPDVFNNKKFYEISSKLDNIAQVNPKSHADRLIVKSPEYHWCYAQTYFLAGNSTQSLEHYKQYKIQSISKSIDNNPILKNL